MNILVWLIFGALAGWIASIIMGKNRKMGAIANIIVGIIGAFLGGWLFSLFGAQGVTGFNLQSLLVAVVGAVALIFIVGLIRR
ncbi:MAG TPA: GlsB/YeaQ/YmgE family stress response membrane protein [Anaerolineales bacterium]|nr:GlsB/YeaQ/YmgE family stress response membrane protein [Anaerolineales bacterium]HMR98180.1 GlsB/YeaQ/YmgE family stress response membrane protein [Anaerolineales bacterium]HNQ95968.1 GlsB/YeaQ/YmgE family stress response membrane protein [Anaerolineales bacterium]HNS60594.1 GlsB/YeaQ/YmgE family stress response membrane protein [Anaerolineales bacterium]